MRARLPTRESDRGARILATPGSPTTTPAYGCWPQEGAVLLILPAKRSAISRSPRASSIARQ